MKIYGLAIVLPLACLSVYAYRLVQEKRSSVPWIYQVFLSFRGPDTRTGFTNFLCKRLQNGKVRVFLDDQALPYGKEIDWELLRAIRTCRIAIPIISEQYAQSEWCLRELTEIMNCHRNHGKSVFPVFYKVDVVDVRGQRGNFGEALSELEKQFSSDEVLKWREALTSVARIRGWISQTTANGLEAELVDMIYERVSSELKTMWIERLPVFIRSVYLYFSKKSKCQVFLAFGGTDVQNGLAAYLFASLGAAGIKVFSHDDPSLIGTDVAGAIWNAINQCQIYIPIFSESFATSSWFLKGLTQMVKCKRTRGQNILPIFYKVRPSQVRKVSRKFRNDMLKHEDPEGGITYERWEQALREVGKFRGWVSEEIANGNEGILVRQVVEKVLTMLHNPQTDDCPIPSTEY